MLKASYRRPWSSSQRSRPDDLVSGWAEESATAMRQKSCFYHIVMAILLGGQVLMRVLRGRVHFHRTLEQMSTAGPGALMPVLLTNVFAGMIFTIQTARELERFGATYALGGAFALGFCRELAPILTAGILAGQVGTAFAAEIGCMKVTDQLDALKVLRTCPIDYLVVPRVVACCIMLPVITVVSVVSGVLAGATAAQALYNIPMAQFLDSIRSLLIFNDLLMVLMKSILFGAMVGLAGCTWGLTTTCSRSVGQSATSAVVTTWVSLFVVDFFISLVMLQGAGITLH